MRATATKWWWGGEGFATANAKGTTNAITIAIPNSKTNTIFAYLDKDCERCYNWFSKTAFDIPNVKGNTSQEFYKMSLSDPLTFDNVGDHINQCLTAYPLNDHQKYIIKEMLDTLADKVGHELFMASLTCTDTKAACEKVAEAIAVDYREL